MPDLPDFFVIGAMKGGTTSLFHYVTQHPDVWQQAEKEPFTLASPGTPPPWCGPGDQRHIVTKKGWTLESYRSAFRRPAGLLAGDFSTGYLPTAGTADRVLDAVPDARVVAILRDPVTRAHSAWKMWRGLGEETLSFADALAAEDERTAAGWAPPWQYRRLGCYGTQVGEWLDRVGAERLLLLRSEDLDRDPVATTQRVFAHIGVDPTFVPDTGARHNQRSEVPRSTHVTRWMHDTRSPSKRLAMRLPAPVRRRAGRLLRRTNTAAPVLDPGLADELRRGYADEVSLLIERTGLDVAHWLPGS